MLAACAPEWKILIMVPHSANEDAKFSVPSIGSTTATHPLDCSSQPAWCSSPTNVRSGRASRNSASSASCTRRSAAVTGVSSALSSILDRSAVSPGIISSRRSEAFLSASRAISVSCSITHHPKTGDILESMSNHVASAVSPIEQFITDVVEPKRSQMHVWKNTQSHEEILLEDAQKRRKTRPFKLGSNYLFTRKAEPVGGFDSGVTTLVSGQAQRATQSIELCRTYLQASNVPTLTGKSFDTSELAVAEQYFRDYSSSATVQPDIVGSTTILPLAVTTAEGLKSEWGRVQDALGDLKPADRRIHLQIYRPDLTVRMFVIREDVVAAVLRVPFYLIGDGESSVTQLVQRERETREECDYLGSRSLKVEDEQLSAMNLDWDDILPAGDVRVLPSSSEQELGGLISVDVLEQLHGRIRELAVDAMWAFPGLSVTAVDIMTPRLDSPEGAQVISVLPAASISDFLYPALGQPRRCGVRILDQMIRSVQTNRADRR